MIRVKRLPIGITCLFTYPVFQSPTFDRLFVHDKRASYGPLFYSAWSKTFHGQLVRIILYSGNEYLVKSLTTNCTCWAAHQLLTPVSFKEL